MALSLKHGVAIKEILDYGDNLIYRFSNRLLGDTVVRVGRDPVRKLAATDRLAGAALFCQEQGIKPACILTGIAAGYLFAPEDDQRMI